MQFDEETGRKPQSAQVPPLSPSVNPPADDEANVERGVRILGFFAGGFTGNLLVSLADGLSGSGTLSCGRRDQTVSVSVSVSVSNFGGYETLGQPDAAAN